MSADRRIPVVFGAQPEQTDAVLLEEGFAPPPAQGYVLGFTLGGHVLGCACCVAQSPIGTVLGVAFRARATGEAPFFGRVVVLASAASEAAVRAALGSDVMARARFATT